MTRLSEPMRRALAVLAETEVDLRWSGFRRKDTDAFVAVRSTTLEALVRNGLAKASLASCLTRWRITDAGRAEHER